MKFMEDRLIEMQLSFIVREGNAKICTRISQGWYVKHRANMGFELSASIFVKNDVRFIEVNSLTRGLSKFVKNGKDYLESFIRTLTEQDDVAHESKVSDINIFLKKI